MSGWHIDSGRYGETTLDGLNAVQMVHSAGHMANGNFRVAFYLDERANAAQREALSTIFSIKPGGAFASMAKAVAQDLGVRFVPVTVESSGKRRKLSIGGIGDADVTAVVGQDNKDVLLYNVPDNPEQTGPLVVGRSARTTYNDYDIHLDVSGKGGGYSPFAISST